MVQTGSSGSPARCWQNVPLRWGGSVGGGSRWSSRRDAGEKLGNLRSGSGAGLGLQPHPKGGQADHFRTGWFVESLWTELAVAFVLRTERPFWRSAPSGPLVWSSGLVAAAGVALPASPLGPWLGFAGMDVAMLGLLVPIVGAYVLAVEAGKRWAARRRSVPTPS